MSFKFEKLEIWKDARKFCNEVYSVTKNFPKEERFCLIDQLRRAALSIVLNIAEGSMKQSDLEFKRFLKIAQGSLCEVVSGFFIALDQNYVDKVKFDKIYESSDVLSARLRATMNSLSQKR